MTLRNWIQGNRCIARNETEYLQHEDDLIALSSREDGTMTFLVEWVEDKLIRLPGNMYKVGPTLDHTWISKSTHTDKTCRVDAEDFLATSWFIFLMGI